MLTIACISFVVFLIVAKVSGKLLDATSDMHDYYGDPNAPSCKMNSAVQMADDGGMVVGFTAVILLFSAVLNVVCLVLKSRFASTTAGFVAEHGTVIAVLGAMLFGLFGLLFASLACGRLKTSFEDLPSSLKNDVAEEFGCTLSKLQVATRFLMFTLVGILAGSIYLVARAWL